MEEYEVLKGKGNVEKRDRSLTRVTLFPPRVTPPG